MTASDGDKDRPQNIVYFLTGQGIDPDNPANSKFDINRTTGEIFVLKVSGIWFIFLCSIRPKNNFNTKLLAKTVWIQPLAKSKKNSSLKTSIFERKFSIGGCMQCVFS